ncbi:TTC5 protein, partial [Rhipidura dahli]|nr:TTC5 protein [Rhipidura dahli]
ERVDPTAAANPDLHLNRATLLQYLEQFQAALEGLSRAAELAPGWEEPRKRHGNLLEFLSRLCSLLANRVGHWGKLGATGRGLGAMGRDWGALGGNGS